MVDLATPQGIARTRALSQMLGQTALQGPIQSPWQGFAGLARALASGTLARRAETQQQARNQAAQEALQALVSPMGMPITPGAGGGPVPLPGVSGGMGGSPVPLPGAPSGTATPGLQQLLATQQQFPELAGALGPMISAAMNPKAGPETFSLVEDPAALGLPEGTVAQRGSRGGIEVLSRPAAEGALVKVFDPDSPTGSRLVTRAEAVGMAAPRGSNETIETFTNPDGTQGFRVVRGSGGTPTGGGEGLTKPTTTSLEKDIVQANERLSRIRNIRESFDPAFLNLPNQVFTKGAALAERFGVELGPETKQKVAEFTEFRTNTLQNLNRTLNELSGAAVSPAEAERLKAELPTETDSPTEFASKVANIEAQLEAAIARNQVLLEGGVRNLQFGKNGEILNAPSLEEFMLRQERDRQAAAPAGNVSRETTQAGAGAAPQGNISQMGVEDLLNVDITSMNAAQREAWEQRMNELGM